jgi:hypothetical protein
MKKPLSHFRHMNRCNIATLSDGIKTIMKVTTPRTKSFWLVIPARGDNDAMCVLLKKYTITKFCSKPWADQDILKYYADRIDAAARIDA